MTEADIVLAAIEELVRANAFIRGGIFALHAHVNGPVDVEELEPFWPAMPDLQGQDLFAEYGIAGVE